jgi:hypothetical protein
MKRTKAIAVFASLLILFIIGWLCVPPAEQAEAQINPYGPNVTSDIKGFDIVVKTAATHDVIAGVDGKRFRILSMFVRSNSSTANNIYFAEEGGSDTMYGTNSTDVETLDQLGINGKAGWETNVWRETTTAGADFEITLSEAQPVAVVGTYVEIH